MPSLGMGEPSLRLLDIAIAFYYGKVLVDQHGAPSRERNFNLVSISGQYFPLLGDASIYPDPFLE